MQLRGAIDAAGEALWTPFVRRIDYNHRGQRASILYGNNTTTEYTYDNLSFRLLDLHTTRPESHPTGQRKVQDLRYTYDPAGNVITIRDSVQQVIYFDNQVVSPTTHYTYDALYRLTLAIGREHAGQTNAPYTTWDDGPRFHQARPNDGQAMRVYQESYRYDDIGNLLELIHTANNGNWMRFFAYEEPSLLDPANRNNRLSHSRVGAINEPYTYDPHGNVTSMSHLSQLVWDERDHLHRVSRSGGGSSLYCYDSNGQRVRKIVERQNGTRAVETIYLGSFEIYREYDATGSEVTLERETLHITDDERRIALVETRTRGHDDSPAQLIRYQYANLTGSACLELDDRAQVLSYEEYHPFGTTSFQSVQSHIETSKRFRFTGKERDLKPVCTITVRATTLRGWRAGRAWIRPDWRMVSMAMFMCAIIP